MVLVLAWRILPRAPQQNVHGRAACVAAALHLVAACASDQTRCTPGAAVLCACVTVWSADGLVSSRSHTGPNRHSRDTVGFNRIGPLVLSLQGIPTNKSEHYLQ